MESFSLAGAGFEPAVALRREPPQDIAPVQSVVSALQQSDHRRRRRPERPPIMTHSHANGDLCYGSTAESIVRDVAELGR
jgi:hypothetical protein